MHIPEPVQKIMDRLEHRGFHAWLAGGCVRDSLMGKEPHDYDIATQARPEQVMELFDRVIPTGLAHGTVTVMEDGMPVEVTTLRKEGRYKDHRHPDNVEFVSEIEEDLARRDFTINAMAWNPKTGLTDPFGGQEDLKKGIIRAVGNPAERFDEDALRMMRAYRFAGRLGFQIEEGTRQAIDEKAGLLKTVSAERVRDEIQQILKDSPEILDQMTVLLKDWLPELKAMLDCEQNNKHHYTDVLHHTLDALKASKSKDLEVLWALLLHDTGKPSMKTTDESGDHFKKHPMESARIARKAVRRFKLPKKMQHDIEKLVLYHDAFYAPKLSNIYKIRIERGLDDEFLHRLWDVQRGDIGAHTTFDREKTLNAFIEFYNREKEQRPLSLRDLKINGSDLLAMTSLRNSQIKEALNLILRKTFYQPELNVPEQKKTLAKWAEQEITNRK
ncbi:MAG: CCA tRNA nucleotidyltransferase [Erysipelotrichaceae bacterium]|nr:CCA tRNA nucleotidyltransferase [Erysipelotrichaceae bacterium]